MRRPWALGTIAAIGLIVVGCGSSKKSASTAGAATPPSTAAASSNATRGPYAPATGGASAGGQQVTVATKASKLGTILAAGPKHKTVYLFEADKGASSSCSGGCASVWPPVPASTAPLAGGKVSATKLGVITRADGTRQVTYNGHPLYFYSRDGDAGDAYGQGIKSFGADWYVLAPSGSKLEKS